MMPVMCVRPPYDCCKGRLKVLSHSKCLSIAASVSHALEVKLLGPMSVVPIFATQDGQRGKKAFTRTQGHFCCHEHQYSHHPVERHSGRNSGFQGDLIKVVVCRIDFADFPFYDKTNSQAARAMLRGSAGCCECRRLPVLCFWNWMATRASWTHAANRSVIPG